MTTSIYSIGTLSKKTHCKIPTIRYYEQEGVLAEPQRTSGNQRRYTDTHLRRLQFICHARQLGFTLEDIRELIRLSTNEESPQHADQIAERHLKEVEYKIERLNALKNELNTMLNDCRQGNSQRCNVIDVLSDHALCKNEH